jgi:hypothetical protein
MSCEETLPLRKYVLQANSIQTPLPPLPQTRPRLDHPPKPLARTGNVHTVSLRGEQAHHTAETAEGIPQLHPGMRKTLD